MNNYIQIYNNVLSNDYCDELREKFDSMPCPYEEFYQGPMSFSQLNLNNNKDWKKDTKKITSVSPSC